MQAHCSICPSGMQTLVDEAFTFKSPFTSVLAGPTCSGKSTWLLKLVNNLHLIQPQPEHVVLCRGCPTSAKFPDFVKIIEGLPKSFDSVPRNTLLILDDLGRESNNSALTTLFSRGCHHRQISVVSVQQNIFQNKDRTQRANCMYYVLMNNPIDSHQVQALNRQVFPKTKHFLAEVMEDIAKEAWGYCILDLHSRTPSALRVVSHIFREDAPNVIYQP